MVIDRNKKFVSNIFGRGRESAENGLFIVFEGIDGSGKSTQLKVFAEKLRNRGCLTVETKEPNDLPGWAIFKKKVLTQGVKALDRFETIRMVEEARREHINKIINPALSRGSIVVSDRYTESTAVYQNFAGRGRLPQGAPRPNLTFLFDLPAKDAARRIRERGGVDDIGLSNVFEAEKRRLAYLSRVENDKSGYVVIDALGTVEEVAERCWEAFDERVIKKGLLREVVRSVSLKKTIMG